MRAVRFGTLMIAALLAVPLLVGCGGGDEQPAGASAGQPPAGRGGAHGGPGGRPAGPGGGERGAGPHAPREGAAVAIEVARRGSIASYYSSTATLEPEKQAGVVARAAGLVLDIAAEEGDWVEQGETLLTIEDAEYRHRLKQASAEAELQQARYQRLSQLKEEFDNDFSSAEELETALADLRTAEAARDLAALELSHTRVTAPFAGMVVARLVDPGQMVSAGTELFTLADTRPLRARVHVPAKEFRQIHTAQTVELSLDSSDETLQGEITLVSPVIDPTSGTIKVTVEIRDYPAGIRAGDFATVRIVTARHEQAVLVPKIAVFSDKGEQIAFVLSGNLAVRRQVETGFQDEGRIEILGGIVPGDSVVTQGQRSLEDCQPARVVSPANAPASAASEGGA